MLVIFDGKEVKNLTDFKETWNNFENAIEMYRFSIDIGIDEKLLNCVRDKLQKFTSIMQNNWDDSMKKYHEYPTSRTKEEKIRIKNNTLKNKLKYKLKCISCCKYYLTKPVLIKVKELIQK